MARKRDYKAEYRARVEREKARGYRNYYEARARRAEGRPRHTDPNSTRVPVHVSTPAGKVTTSRSERTIRAALREAEANGQKVTLKLTGRTEDGKWRTRTVDRLTGQAGAPVGASQATGAKVPGSGNGADLSGPVQVVAGPAAENSRGGGIDPRELLYIFDAYEEYEDALYELWAEEYG